MNPDSDQLLHLLNKTKDEFGRFRNVYVQDNYIVVHTRCGGGNREYYEDMFDDISNHPWYSHNQDDDFDCTYADIFFEVPHDVREVLSTLDKGHLPTEQWASFLEVLKTK